MIDGVYRCAFTWHNAGVGRDAANVMHFRSSSLVPATLFSALAANVTSTMWDQTGSDTKITQVAITPLDGTSPTVTLLTDGSAKWGGGQSAGDVAPQMCAIASLKTDTRGRSYRGRVYLPFVAEGAQANGSLGSGIAVAMTTAWATFIAAAAGDDAHMVVASYKLAEATDVASVTVESLCATQRRRQPR